MRRVTQELRVPVKEPVINAPAVDASGIEGADGFLSQPESVEQAAKQRQHVPLQHASGPDRDVRKAVHEPERQPVGRAAPGNHAATRSTKVDGSDGGAAAARHRRNAAAIPASTGTCSPVVCDRSPAVSANTAAATCSGSTSRLSRVRCA